MPESGHRYHVSFRPEADVRKAASQVTSMESYEDEKAVVRRIRDAFPVAAARTDEWMRDRWEEPDEAPHIWVEAFADQTNEAALSGDWPVIREHTEFMADAYRTGSSSVRSLVDVAYAENLMWNVEDAAKVIAWPHVAIEVRELYERMWGPPGASPRPTSL